MTEAIAAIAGNYTAEWNSGSAEAVASFYAETGGIVINRAPLWDGRAGVQTMAEGFFLDVPDLNLICDGVRIAGEHVAFLWTFTGHHTETHNPVRIAGWEEWDMDADGKVIASRGWLEAADYARQVAG